MVGFGVKTPEMAAQVGQVADGVIVASALIDQFQDALADGDARSPAFLGFVEDRITSFRKAIDEA